MSMQIRELGFNIPTQPKSVSKCINSQPRTETTNPWSKHLDHFCRFYLISQTDAQGTNHLMRSCHASESNHVDICARLTARPFQISLRRQEKQLLPKFALENNVLSNFVLCFIYPTTLAIALYSGSLPSAISVEI